MARYLGPKLKLSRREGIDLNLKSARRAAVCHNFGLASSVEGPSEYGPVAVIICLIIVAVIALTNINKTVKE